MNSRELNLNVLAHHGALAGIMAIAGARLHQVQNKGFNPRMDDGYSRGELVRAAFCYLCLEVGDGDNKMVANPDQLSELSGADGEDAPWPWAPEWFKPKTPVENLERAGALIAAEIDRLQRAGAEARQLPLWIGIDFAEPDSERTVLRYQDGSVEVSKVHRT